MKRTLASLGVAAAMVGSAAADELLDRLAAVTPPADDEQKCSVTMTMDSREGEERDLKIYRYDAVTEEMKLTGPPEAVAAQAEKEADEAPEEDEPEKDDDDEESVSFGMIPYAVALDVEALPYERVADEEGLAVYKAAPLPKGTFEPSGRDMSKRSAAYLFVKDGETPVIRRYVYELQKEIRIPMVARVRELRQETRYDDVAGKVRPVGMAMTFDADVMGSEQQGTFEMTLSDHDCPANAAD